MALRDLVQNAFRALGYTPLDTDKIKGKLPFIHLLGYEKAYGKPHPQDYLRMVQAYKSWVYACAWKNATTVAKNKLCLYKVTENEDGEEDYKKISKHPFNDVISRVNPFSNAFELKVITQLNLELTGNAYWWIPRNQLGVPYMIWNIPSHWMRVVPSQEEFISGYIMQVPGQGKLIPFDEPDIVHFKFPSPVDLFYGSGPTIAASFGIDMNEEIKTWGINYFLNNANPGGILTTESSLSPDQYKRLRDQWNEKYKGVKNAGKMAFLENGLKYQQTGSNMREARMDDISPEIQKEIFAIFGVPASKLGLESHDNRATAEASDYTYQTETILPRLTLIEEKLNEKMIPIYDVGLVCKFDNSVPEDKTYKLQERQINISSGYSSIDEERERDGLDPYDLPETKVPLIPFGLNPAGTPKPEVNPMGMPVDEGKAIQKAAKGDKKWEVFAIVTAPQEKLMTGAMKRFFEDQHSEVIRKLNQHKAMTKDLLGFILFNLNEANNKLKGKVKPGIKTAVVTGLELGIKDTGHAIDFKLFEPNILRMTEARANFVAERINSSTAQLLKEALDEGFKNGESIADIGKRVDNIYNFSEDFRSKRIAQTEVIGATNEGQLRAYDEAGVKQKEWISARDEKVRESHQIDGQVVDLHQSFRTGANNLLNYPGDRSTGAPPEEVINCRCTVLPVIKV